MEGQQSLSVSGGAQRNLSFELSHERRHGLQVPDISHGSGTVSPMERDQLLLGHLVHSDNQFPATDLRPVVIRGLQPTKHISACELGTTG